MKEKYKLLTAKEVCQQLKVCRKTLYRLLRSGRLPGFKVGHQWRFGYGEIEYYFRNLTHTSPTLYDIKVLEKYTSQPERFEIKEALSPTGRPGWEIRYRNDFDMSQLPRSEIFDFIRYTYRSWRGQKVVKLMPHEKLRLSHSEYLHWYRHQIKFESTVSG